MTMPNFLIIGANKAGTSSLYAYLKQHPQIYMSPIKEPMFFTLEGKVLDKNQPGHEIVLKESINNIEDYRALFQGVSNEKAIGEASTTYLHNPVAAERIKHYIPDAKLIAILRNPVERAYSNYLMYVRWGLEPASDFAQAVKEEEIRICNNWPSGWHYVGLGFYYKRLKHYFELFEEHQLKVYLYEDWSAEPLRVLKDIFLFLDVDESFVPNMSVRHNVSKIPKSKALHSFLMEENTLKSVVKRLLPTGVRQRIKTAIIDRNIGKPKLSCSVRKQLIEVYRQDILKLQDLIQRDLSKWLLLEK